MFDARAIRRDFPILAREAHGKPLVYLDNGATSQKPVQVIDAISDFYRTSNANVHRGIHLLSEEATDGFELARRKLARFIGAPRPESVVFVRNATEAINLVAHAWGDRFVGEGDEILLTEMEHHSNLVPWQLLAQRVGARLQFIRITDEGRLDLSELDQLLTERTRLVAVTHMSNVLGTINPVRMLAARAHAAGAVVLVDGAQSVPHLPVDVEEIGCDFLAFSGHKMMGPTGIGVLYGRPELLEQMNPFLGGGSMIRDVWLDHATWAGLPEKFEAGTPDIAGAIGLGAAVDYLTNLGMADVRAHETELASYALEVLTAVPGLRVYGPCDPQERGGVVTFNLEDVHPHDLATILDREGVAIRAGHHCCRPLMRRLDVPATARASFYVYNLPGEVDALAAALQKARGVFGHVFSLG